MSKLRIPNQRKANIAHKQRTEGYAMLIRQVYDRLAGEAARIASFVTPIPGRPFSFSDYPETRHAFGRLQTEFLRDVGAVVMAGTTAEWKESNLVQDLMADKVLKAYSGQGTADRAEYVRYYQTNPDALKAFQRRRDYGMTLLDRVWNLKEEFRMGIEDSISAAIAPGVSAQQLSIDVRKYLQEPDLMFRRFRYKDEQRTADSWKRKWKKRTTDEEGNVRFVDCEKETYANQWTGSGYYKSAYQNAMRLARTEINMAYRTAEQERWKQFDFVVGYEVKASQNVKDDDHPNGKHVPDICDRLAGRYPKTFRFVGWHPNCMCYAIPILKTEEEFREVGDGGDENEVTDVPEGFKDWVKDNEERIGQAAKKGTLPYFLRDNRDAVEKVLHPKNDTENITSSLHTHYGLAMKLGRAATKEAMKFVEDIGAPELTEIQKKNIQELADALGIPRNEIKPMSFLDADQGTSNPTYDRANCQSVIIAFEARRRGLNCYALPYSNKIGSASYALGERFQDAWLNPKTGKIIEPTVIKGSTDSDILLKLKRQLNADGRYVLGVNEKNGRGHLISIDRVHGNIVVKDEQLNDFLSINSIENISYLEVLKIDKAILNIPKVKSVLSFL